MDPMSAETVALRLRDLQESLAPLGLSSLGRGESHVRATLGAALRVRRALSGEPLPAVDLAAELIEAGMDRARINTAHDDAAAWRRMIDGVRTASERLGRPETDRVRLASSVTSPRSHR